MDRGVYRAAAKAGVLGFSVPTEYGGLGIDDFRYKAALVLGLLGVPETDIIADFALTGLATKRLVAAWQAENPERTLRWPGYGQAPAQLMRLFLDDLAARYGSVRGYAIGRLGMEHKLIEAMRAHLLHG